MEISIIIPSYNTQETIGATLKSVSQQQCEQTFEIIIVDCSDNDLVEEMAKQYPNIRFVRRAERFNPGVGRNIGADLAQGQLLVFIDADIQLTPYALSAAWNRFKEGLSIFGGALELNSAQSNSMAAYLEHYYFNHEAQTERPFCERRNLSSAFACFSRDVFVAEGGFKDIPRMQDTEFTERLRNRGYRLYFCPDLIAYQTQDAPMRKVFSKIYINGQNLYYIRYKKSITRLKRALFLLALPGISLAKTVRIIGRHLRYQAPGGKLRTLALSPVLVVGGVYWMFGFYNALLTEKGINTRRS